MKALKNFDCNKVVKKTGDEITNEEIEIFGDLFLMLVEKGFVEKEVEKEVFEKPKKKNKKFDEE